jgi:protein-L-isoaspartate(D-aspartate) O-methyltransferase
MAGDLLEDYAWRLREMGAIQSASVYRAFATVPRHRFLRRIMARSGGSVEVELPVGEPLSTELAELIYADEALVTRLAGEVPTSSSSQPSLMARMLEELRLAPGHRVLEIGAGTGYNAALIATITGAPVVSVDVQPDVVEETRAALEPYPQARVVLGDGYAGHPADGPYDRIIVTCGVGGLSPAWLDQLTPEGQIIAPVHHGGGHPTMAAWRAPDGRIAGQAVLSSDFMTAAGPLHPGFTRSPTVEFDWPPAVHPYPFRELDLYPYLDLWFAAAVHEPAIDRRPVIGFSGRGECGLPGAGPGGSGLVLIQQDAIRAFGAAPAAVDLARSLVERWVAAGRPPLSSWWCEFPPENGIYRPRNWYRR